MFDVVAILILAVFSTIALVDCPVILRVSILVFGILPAATAVVSYFDVRIPLFVGLSTVNGGLICGILIWVGAKLQKKKWRFRVGVCAAILCLTASSHLIWLVSLLLNPGT